MHRPFPALDRSSIVGNYNKIKALIAIGALHNTRNCVQSYRSIEALTQSAFAVAGGPSVVFSQLLLAQ